MDIDDDDDIQEVVVPEPAPSERSTKGKKQRRSSQQKSSKQQGEVAFVDLTCDNDPIPTVTKPGKVGRPRGSTKENYGLRRKSAPLVTGGVELQMECEEDALTPSQVEAHKKAREEYKKAMKAIEQAKLAAVVSQQPVVSPVSAKALGTNASLDDIIILGESPPMPAAAVIPKRSPAQPQQPRMSTPVAVPPPPQVMVPHGAPFVASPAMAGAAVPQQVYRFVSYGQNSPGNVAAPNQWLIRPIMHVVPQQQMEQKAVTSLLQPPLAPPPGYTSTIVSGTSGLGIKRSPNMPDLPTVSPPAKKPRGRQSSETDSSGNWVPLDEYYYGKMEGDPTYFEEKAEFRFKCWMCTKMLYNNVKAMMHLQGHIDSEKQQNLDLSDLTQCKHCYKQFDTPFEMQTHIEKVHMNNVNVLMCRICEKDHDSRGALTTHMRQNHCACEMPYVCQLCNFRSSMYSDVVDHFKKKHDASNNMLCLYCLRVFHVKFVSQGWGQTQAFYHHLLKHQSKTHNRKCTFCKLSFFNAQDLKNHRRSNHQPNQKGVIGANAKYNTPDQVMIKVPETGLLPKKSTGPKSLNAPTVTKVKEHRGLRFPRATTTSYCFECKMLMSTADHYKKYIQCSMCRFATSCSFAYASHMMGFHSGQVSSLSTTVPWERLMDAPLHCLCGFSSKYGNKIANHLVSCSKRTCYLVKPEASLLEKHAQDEQTDPRRKPGASILDVLGLVKKQSLVSANEEEGEEGGAPFMDDTYESDGDDWKEGAKTEEDAEGGEIAEEGMDQSKEPDGEVSAAAAASSDAQGETHKTASSEESAKDATSVQDEASPNEEDSGDSVEKVESVKSQEGAKDAVSSETEDKPTDKAAVGEMEKHESADEESADADGETGKQESADVKEPESIVDDSETGDNPPAAESESPEDALSPGDAADRQETADDSLLDDAEKTETVEDALLDDTERNETAGEIPLEAPEEDAPTPVNDEKETSEDRLLCSATDSSRAANMREKEETSNVAESEQAGDSAVEEALGDDSVQDTDSAQAGDVALEEALGEKSAAKGDKPGEAMEFEEEDEEMDEVKLIPEEGSDDLDLTERDTAENVDAEDECLVEKDSGRKDDPLADKQVYDEPVHLSDQGKEYEEARDDTRADQDLQESTDTQAEQVEDSKDKAESVDDSKAEQEDMEDARTEQQDSQDAKTEDQEKQTTQDTPAEKEESVEKKKEDHIAETETGGGSGKVAMSEAGDASASSVGKVLEEPSSFPPAAGDFGGASAQPDTGKPEESEIADVEGFETGRAEDCETGQSDEKLAGKETNEHTSGPSGILDDGDKDRARTLDESSKPEDSSAVAAQDSSSRHSLSNSVRPSRDRDNSRDRSDRGSNYEGGDREDGRSDGDKRHSDSRDRSQDRRRDHSDRHDRDYNRDYRRDRDQYEHDDRYRHYGYQDRRHDQRYDSQQGRYPQNQQGGYHNRDRFYDQNRQGGRGGQNRHGYQDRNHHRGYY